MNTVSPNSAPAFVRLPQEGSGKRVANYAVQMYVDNQDGSGPVLQTVYFQAVNVFQLDEYGTPTTADDRVDQEWKRQLLDEMRAIRLGMEVLMETGRPTFDPAANSLIDEARRSRLDYSSGEPLEQEI